jgi:hypothetical protein
MAHRGPAKIGAIRVLSNGSFALENLQSSIFQSSIGQNDEAGIAGNLLVTGPIPR